MIQGKKHINEDVVYTLFKKHYCPCCKEKLKTTTIKKIINYNAPEAKDYDFWVGPTGNRHLVTGDMEFYIKGFKCNVCNKCFFIDEVKKSEKVRTETINEYDITDKKWNFKFALIFISIFVVCYFIYYFVKFIL